MCPRHRRDCAAAHGVRPRRSVRKIACEVPKLAEGWVELATRTLTSCTIAAALARPEFRPG